MAQQDKQMITEINNIETNLSEENATDQVVTLISPIDNRSSSTHVYFKYLSLILFTLQNIIRATLIRYTNTISGPRHIKSTFVFICEIQKLIFSLILVFIQERNIIIVFKIIINLTIKEIYTTMKICLIALIYTIQNNLTLIAISKLDIATYGVTSQLKILTTAIFTKFLLNRHLGIIRWFGLILLFIGISIVEIEKLSSKETKKDVEPIVGLIAIITSCICSGFAGVSFEKIVKTTHISLWIYNIQLAMFSIIISLLTMYIFNGYEIKNSGILYGYTKLVWISTIINSLGGLFVALVIKYSDNIIKGFASSSSIILSCIVAIIFFNFHLTILFSIGSLIVILSIIIYFNPELFLSIPFLKLIIKDKPIFV